MGDKGQSRIEKKIRRAFVQWFALSIGLMLLVSAGVFYIMEKRASMSRKDMTEQAVKNSDLLLTSEMKEQTRRYAECFGSLIESQLARASEPMYMAADCIEQIYSQPDVWPDVQVTYGKELSGSESRLHWLLPEGMGMEGELLEELNKLGNAGSSLKRFSTENSHILRIYFTSVSGINIGYDGDYEKKPGTFDGRETIWYKNACENGSLTLSDAYIDSFVGKLTVTFSMPCYGTDGTLLGVLAADLLIDELEQMIEDLNPGFNGYAMLISGEGKMVAAKGMTEDNASDMAYFLGDNSTKLEKQIKEEKKGAEESVINGREKYLVYSRIASADWSTVIVLDKNEIFKAASESSDSLKKIEKTEKEKATAQFIIICILWAGIAGGLLLLGMVLSRKVSRRISDPVMELCTGVRAVGEENLCYEPHLKTEDELEELDRAFGSMTRSLAAYIEDLSRLTAEKERMETELTVATQIQSSMLPCIFPPFPEREEIDIYATMEPAREVGGDFYDFFLADEDHLCIIMADVSGKGIPAALFMVVSKTLLKDNVIAGRPLGEVLKRVNGQLCENNDAQMFVTAFAAVLDLKSGNLTFVNAGHNPPVVRREDGKIIWLTSPAGFVLAGLKEMEYQEGTMKLKGGDRFFAYTDGVTEAMDTNGSIYGQDRLAALIEGKWNDKISASSMIWTVREDIRDFVKGAEQADDITMLALCYRGRVLRSCIVLEPLENELQKLQDFIEARLWEADYPGKGIQLQMAAEEIFINIAKYAYPDESGEKKGKVEIQCTVKEKEIILTFADSGIPYNPLEREDPDILEPALSRPAGGLGIYLVKKSMDHVEYEYRDGKNVLTIRQSIG